MYTESKNDYIIPELICLGYFLFECIVYLGICYDFIPREHFNFSSYEREKNRIILKNR